MDTIRFLRMRPGAHLPDPPAHEGDVGYDLHTLGDHWIMPGEGKDLPTGIAVEAPVGNWIRIAPRSSARRSRGLEITEGTIDNGYRGELFAYAVNHNDEPVHVKDGDRLAQLIIHPAVVFPIEEVTSLSHSSRGSGGFGSTGSGKVARENPKELIYLGQSIDYRETQVDPDSKHRSLRNVLDDRFKIYCPYCAQIADRQSPAGVIDRNAVMLRDARWAVFIWRGPVDDPSFGVPVELFARAGRAAGTLVVGTMGNGIFARYLTDLGVRMVESVQDAGGILMGGDDAGTGSGTGR